MDDEKPQSVAAVETPVPAEEETPVEQTGEPVIETPSTAGQILEPAPESAPIAEPAPISEPAPTIPVQSAPISPPPIASDQTQPNFIHSLLVKAQAKIQGNKQKKLDKLMELAQKKGKISNEDVCKLLIVSDETATRYLNALTKDGRLMRSGNTNDVRYQFVR